MQKMENYHQKINVSTKLGLSDKRFNGSGLVDEGTTRFESFESTRDRANDDARDDARQTAAGARAMDARDGRWTCGRACAIGVGGGRCGCGRGPVSSTTQTLDECTFDRSAHRRAACGDVEGMRRALERSKVGAMMAVRESDAHGYRVMHHAARSGSVECVESCLALGAEVDARTRAGDATALHKACAGGHAGVVRVLLDAGASAGAVDADGETPLHKACASGDAACVRAVGAADATAANARDRRGKTPMQVATTEKTRAIAAALVIPEAGVGEDERLGEN